MYTETPIATMDQISRLFKDFLWVYNSKMGKCKTPLVVWKHLTQPREKGCLSLKDYVSHEKALLNRWIARSIKDTYLEWTESFMGLIKEFTWEQQRSQNKVHYTDQDRVVFGKVFCFDSMQYMGDSGKHGNCYGGIYTWPWRGTLYQQDGVFPT